MDQYVRTVYGKCIVEVKIVSKCESLIYDLSIFFPKFCSCFLISLFASQTKKVEGSKWYFWFLTTSKSEELTALYNLTQLWLSNEFKFTINCTCKCFFFLLLLLFTYHRSTGCSAFIILIIAKPGLYQVNQKKMCKDCRCPWPW